MYSFFSRTKYHRLYIWELRKMLVKGFTMGELSKLSCKFWQNTGYVRRRARYSDCGERMRSAEAWCMKTLRVVARAIVNTPVRFLLLYSSLNAVAIRVALALLARKTHILPATGRHGSFFSDVIPHHTSHPPLRFTSCPDWHVDFSRIIYRVPQVWVGVSYCAESGRSPGMATGNWGCGAFGGSPRLKCLLQLAACAHVGRPLAYYTFRDRQLMDDIVDVYNLLSKHNVTVGRSFALSYRRKP